MTTLSRVLRSSLPRRGRQEFSTLMALEDEFPGYVEPAEGIKLVEMPMLRIFAPTNRLQPSSTLVLRRL